MDNSYLITIENSAQIKPQIKKKSIRIYACIVFLIIYIGLLIGSGFGFYMYHKHEYKYVWYCLFTILIIYIFCLKCGIAFA